MSKALLLGVTGQDGAYMAHALHHGGWEVVGSTRDRQACNLTKLKRLNICENIKLINIIPSDFRSVYSAIMTHEPDLLVNLSGQTSVALSFEQPVEAVESIATATLNILETLRMTKKKIKFINIGSSECYGETKKAATEETAFRPVSPYGVAKSTAAWHVSSYRQAYGIWASTAILSNHESPLRGNHFVAQKLIQHALQCKNAPNHKAKIGDLSVIRDWGWAPDYVEALLKIADLDYPSDYIVATGVSNSLERFASLIFSQAGLEFKNHLITNKNLYRPLELKTTRLNPQKAEKELGWKSRHSIEEIVFKLMHNKLF